MSDSKDLIQITCPCGKTTVQADMPPIGAGYCHCVDCRKLTQGAAFEGVLWPPSGHLQANKGALTSSPRPDMKMVAYNCSECGIMMYHTESSLLEIISTSEIRRCYGEQLPDGCQPAGHHWYSQRVFDINDDLVKWYDGPAELGKSGKKCQNDGTVVE